MQLSKALEHALDGNAILFTGSGFSYGAQNSQGKSLCTGYGLRNKLASACGIKAEDQSLEIVAQFFTKKKSQEELIAFINNEYHVSKIEKWHETILSIPWSRVYTTNYDSVAENAAAANSKQLNTVVLSQHIKDYDLNHVCVHLNGSVNNLNTNTLYGEFKLTDRSYACESLDGNEWFELFKNDLQSTCAIIIIGYSMQYDVDIKRLLSPPEISKKVVFIDKPNPDELSKEILCEYGQCEFIGIQELANRIRDIKDEYIPSIKGDVFKSFCHERNEKGDIGNITFKQLNDFYTRGSLCKGLFTQTFGQYKYLVLRKAANDVIRDLNSFQVFLVLSDLGNGKTIFCYILRDLLRKENVDVYTLMHDYIDINDEIKLITQNRDRHSVVIIDDYKRYLKALSQFKYLKSDRITFVLTSRKALSTTTLPIIRALNIMESQIKPIYLDYLKTTEITELSQIISNNSLYSADMETGDTRAISNYIKNDCKQRFADLLLKAYNSSDIKNRLASLWSDPENNREDVRELIILALVKTVMGISFNFSEMLYILKLDYLLLKSEDNALLSEFLNIADGEISIKSSVIAREVLKNIIGINTFAELVKKVIFAIDTNYKTNGTYEDLLKNLISHSHFRIFESKATNTDIVISFYDDIRNTQFCKTNIFYWEQFAKACIDNKDYETAQRCIDNAFYLANQKNKNGDNFVPFHICNILSTCLICNLLDKSNKEPIPTAEDAIQTLIQCDDFLLKHYTHPENNAAYTFRVAAKYADIFDRWGESFDVRQQNIFLEKKCNMIRLMQKREAEGDLVGCNLSEWIQKLERCKFK